MTDQECITKARDSVFDAMLKIRGFENMTPREADLYKDLKDIFNLLSENMESTKRGSLI